MIKKNNHKRREIGFTLIEMVIAVSILMLVFLVAGTGLMIVQQTWVKSQKRSDRLKKVILIDKIVNANFANIIPFQWKDEQFKKREIFLGDPSQVIFATTHRVNIIKEGALRFISIYLDGDRLVVDYSNTPLLHWDENNSVVEQEVIAEGINGLSFMYADFDSEGQLIWESDWNEEERKNIPVAIQMTITWDDDSEISWLKRTAGAGKNETYGRRYNDRTR